MLPISFPTLGSAAAPCGQADHAGRRSEREEATLDLRNAELERLRDTDGR
ncbi:hypothetical protein [Nocardioides okcheonensis]|nr:hypothetical protein [Nocardioides okcheonensis]UFN42597.1 hypothetical protein LN652_11020 [Nocardioides okcheonensis]